MMDPADRDRVFIADLSAESTGLSNETRAAVRLDR
jgi:hypothetical protein